MASVLPDPNDALADLAELRAVLQPALAAACDFAMKYHEAQAREQVDPWLLAYHTRDELKHRLLAANVEKTLGFKLIDEPLGAVYLCGGKYEIRLAKAGLEWDEDGESYEPVINGASVTPKREAFLTQPLDFDVDGGPTSIHLVVLYDVDEAGQLTYLGLACPAGPDRGKGVPVYWQIPWAAGTAQDLVAGSGDGLSPSETELLDDLDDVIERPDQHEEADAGTR